MKLSLDKKQIVSLSSSQMELVNGGKAMGEKRSDRRTGDCAFSRKYGVTAIKNEDGEWVATGCYPKCSCR